MEYLGFKISENSITSDPTKLDGILKWPAPQMVTQVKGFLGFCNFYQKFIPQYSEMVEPLNWLSRKDVPWHWGIAQKCAFEQVKKAFKDHVILSVPDLSKPFILETNASLVAVAAVLIQEDLLGNE